MVIFNSWSKKSAFTSFSHKCVLLELIYCIPVCYVDIILMVLATTILVSVFACMMSSVVCTQCSFTSSVVLLLPEQDPKGWNADVCIIAMHPVSTFVDRSSRTLLLLLTVKNAILIKWMRQSQYKMWANFQCKHIFQATNRQLILITIVFTNQGWQTFFTTCLRKCIQQNMMLIKLTAIF